jgi:PAS domain S-box-containing protein
MLEHTDREYTDPEHTDDAGQVEEAEQAEHEPEAEPETLEHSELRYRRLFEAARDGILLLDVDSGRITDANPFMTELLGYPHADLVGKELWQIGLFKDQDASQAAFRQLQERGYIRYEDLPLQTRRGERREVEFVSNVYRENGHTVIQCNIRDITERKAMEAALSEAQRQDKEVALALQRPMLFQPKEDAFSGLTVQTAYAMAADEALVGGDFWDTFAYDHGHVALVLGDVIGHGLTSAIFTTELKHTLRAYIREHEQPARILYQMNQFLYQSNRLFGEGINTEGSDAPVCVALAVIARETGAGTLALAGMEPPILVRAHGQTEQSAAVGTPLGIVPNEQYTQVDFQLEAGDTLILTTDGITEARQGQTFLDAAGLMRLAVAANGGTLKEMADAILNGAREFAGGTLRDDASLVLVRRTSRSPHLDKKRSDP